MRSAWILAGAMVLVPLAGCGSHTASKHTPFNRNPGTTKQKATRLGKHKTVTLSGGFSPRNIIVPAGTQITFRNTSGSVCTLVFPTIHVPSTRLPGHGSRVVILKRSGVYQYQCREHPSKKGGVQVTVAK